MPNSAKECIAWAVIYVTESIAIATINAITIVAFMRNSNLRKRSTYLLINLAVTDVFVGLTGSYTFYELGTNCFFWKASLDQRVLFLAVVLRVLFRISSLLNITNISLERLHATFLPFKHRFVRKCFYWVVIVMSYLLATFLSCMSLGLLFDFSLEQTFILMSSLTSICIAVIVLRYSLILIKVRCRPHPRHHVEVSREKKLTVTLFIVTAVSLLMWLPFIVNTLFWLTNPSFISWSSYVNVVVMFLDANSLVNPILYSIRMPEFRRALKKMFCKPRQDGRVQDFRLNAVQHAH